MRSKKDGVKTDYKKHSNKEQKRTHHKKVRRAGKKMVRTEEDAESYKDLKKKGKVSLNAPKVKQRNAFAPLTKKHKSKKGKGSYNRKAKYKEDEESVMKEQKELISRMVDCIIEKNYSQAHKYLESVMEAKLQDRIMEELTKPLF